MPVSELPDDALAALLAHFGLRLRWLSPDAAIPGSYWGEPEAGRRLCSV